MDNDRRKSPRLALKLPVVLTRRNQTAPISSETEDISITGFYCLTEEPLAPGEVLECRISLPESNAIMPGSQICLEAEAEVLRVALDHRSTAYGCACRIIDYRVQFKQ